MNSGTERLPILILGVTTDLGIPLAKASLANPQLLVNIFVRNISKIQDLAAQIKEKGGKVFEGDLSEATRLDEATKDIHTVVCLIGVHDEKTLENEKALIDISIQNGVKRFVPAEFGADPTKIPKEILEKLPALNYKQKIRDYLGTKPIKSTYVTNGAFEHYFKLLLGDFVYYGDPSTKLNAIALDDLGKLTAAALSHEDFTGEVFFSGDEFTIVEAVQAYNKAKGTNLEAKRAGSIDDLARLFEEKVATGNHGEILGTGLKYLLLSGKLLPDRVDNEKYLKIKTQSIEDIFRRLG